MSACDVCAGAEETFCKLCEDCAKEEAERDSRLLEENERYEKALRELKTWIEHVRNRHQGGMQTNGPLPVFSRLSPTDLRKTEQLIDWALEDKT